MKPLIMKLPRVWMLRSLKFGTDARDSYLKEGSKKDQSRSRPGVLTINRQMLGKSCECVLCLYQGMDPMKALDWRTPKPDVGWDLIIRTAKVDVKGTDTEYLMWNVRKRHELVNCPADRFVLIRRLKRPPKKEENNADALMELDQFEVTGWIGVKEFIAKHHVAGPDHPHLEVHTQHMHMSEIRPFTEANRAGFRNGFVGYDEHGLFRHFCRCGTEAGNGFGVSLRQNKLGIWYCPEHLHEAKQ